jgi:hypothetical protein
VGLQSVRFGNALYRGHAQFFSSARFDALVKFVINSGQMGNILLAQMAYPPQFTQVKPQSV